MLASSTAKTPQLDGFQGVPPSAKTWMLRLELGDLQVYLRPMQVGDGWWLSE